MNDPRVKDKRPFSQQCKLVSSHANYFLIFSVPLIFTLIISLLILNQLYPVSKNILEITALIVLGAFFIISVVRFTLSKDNYFIWASSLLLILLIREIHPPGSSLGVYIGILILLYVAHKKFHLFSDYFLNSKFINLLALGFFTYFIAVTTDQRFWKFIPGENIVHVPLEESLEVIGHLLVGYGLVFLSNKDASLK